MFNNYYFNVAKNCALLDGVCGQYKYSYSKINTANIGY